MSTLVSMQVKKTITIDACKERVWYTLLDHQSYREGTSVFAGGSHVDTDWQSGSTAMFKDADGNGLISRIIEHIPNGVIVVEHRGVLVDGAEDYVSEEARVWHGLKERYTVTDTDGVTVLAIMLDVPVREGEWMSHRWDEALQKLKHMAEQHSMTNA